MTKYEGPEAKFLREAIRHRVRDIVYQSLSGLLQSEDVQNDLPLFATVEAALDEADKLRNDAGTPDRPNAGSLSTAG